MTNILILGANGQLARHTTAHMLAQTDARLTLYLRRAGRLHNPDPARVRMVDADVTNLDALTAAMNGQDVVYANLSGDMAHQAKVIIDAMHASSVKRLIFISSMGIYGEVPGQPYKKILDPYRDSAALIKESDLDYTILRPGWFTGGQVDYHLTQKGQPFIGYDVSLNSLSELITKLALSPTLHLKTSIGVSRY